MSKREMFQEYPDIVNIKQLCKMLGGVSTKAAYQCLREGKIAYFRLGRGFRIPKDSVIKYILEQTKMKDV